MQEQEPQSKSLARGQKGKMKPKTTAVSRRIIYHSRQLAYVSKHAEYSDIEGVRHGA